MIVRSVQALAKALHKANEWQYDECAHGKYNGGPNNGEPYAMCQIIAGRVIRELTPVGHEPVPEIDPEPEPQAVPSGRPRTMPGGNGLPGGNMITFTAVQKAVDIWINELECGYTKAEAEMVLKYVGQRLERDEVQGAIDTLRGYTDLTAAYRLIATLETESRVATPPPKYVKATTQTLMICPLCGAAVLNEGVHTTWHQEEGQDRE